MKYLLIDTNSWIELYLETVEEKNLEQLLKWEKDGKIKFLLPDTLNQELIRQKGIQLNLLQKKIKNLSNTTTKETLARLKEEYRLTEIKIAKIESVLVGAIKIKITNKLHKIIGIKYTTGQPPFHKQNSHNDAYIYFSSVEYLQKKKVGSFVFISKNVTDFGAPENPNLNIHPGLLVPDLEVQYFSAVALAVNKLQKELGTEASNDTNSAADYTEIFNFFPNEKELTIQDQVYLALTKFHEQLPFIPTHLLARVFPFKTENFRHPEAYYSAFQLNSNNEKLIEFFNSFSINKSNVIHLRSGRYKGKEKKVKATIPQIVKLLRANLIYTIEGIGNSLHADIQTLHEENCNCIRCTYNRFDIYNAFLLLDNTKQENNADILKQAYMHYQFQQFDKALKLYFIVYSSIKDKDQPILMFICLTNLKRLSRIITNYGNSANPEAMQIIKELNNISLRKTRLSIPVINPFVNEVIDWIADDNFHSQALENITHTVEKIADHYNIQLRGGYSTNSNFDNLISQFAELDVFLESNFLVYNNFQEFEKVVDKLMEGLFMIYSFNKKQSTRIAFINDYLMSRIIMYAKTENIIKYYNRYHLSSLKYKNSPTTNSQLPELAISFFSGLEKLYKSEDYKKSTQALFFDKNRRVLNNFLVALTLAHDRYNYDQIFESLFPVLELDRLIMREEVNALADLISRKGKYIAEPLLNKLLQFAFENKHFHEHKIFQALSKLITKDRKKIIISDPILFESIKINFTGTCSLCNHSHTDLLMHVIPILNEDYQAELKQLIMESLNQNFNPDLYYTLAIAGAIDFNIHLNKFKELCVRPLNKKEGPNHPFMKGETILYRLSELLNLYFKNGLSTKDEFFIKFKGFSDYYDWILDPDTFDYKKFNPLWILEYQTHFYLKRLFSSATLLKHLIPILKSKKHAILNDLFIKYIH